MEYDKTRTVCNDDELADRACGFKMVYNLDKEKKRLLG
jgi:hypothetical protein